DTSDAAHAYTASIDWGDGSSSNGTLVGDGVGLFHVVGTHTYAAEGPYPVDVRVDSTETQGVTATAHSHAVVFSYTSGGSFVVGEDRDGNGSRHDLLRRRSHGARRRAVIAGAAGLVVLAAAPTAETAANPSPRGAIVFAEARADVFDASSIRATGRGRRSLGL